MFRPGQRIGVAVSGGADSVCLLHVLRELAPRWELRLAVLHLDHGLRGEESRQDAEFVRAMAADLGLPFELRRAELAASPGNLEQAAREARLAFFRDAMAHGALDRVALGHTLSDQAETVLFRFLRGASTAGLAGIRPVTDEGLVRPLIELERCEIEEFLRQRNIAWREDSTNAGMAFARNRIRHSLLPQMAREWNPGIRRTLAHTADWALAEEAYWSAEIDRVAGRVLIERDGAVLVRAADLTALPLAVARRLVRRAIERVKGDLRGIDFDHIGEILNLASPGKGHGCAQVAGLAAMRSFDWVRFARPNQTRSAAYAIPVCVPGIVHLPDAGFEMALELLDKPGTSEIADSVYNIGMGCVGWSRLSGPLEMRNWRPGDRYQPVGYTGEEKVKTLFHRARIPVWERGAWPVLTQGGAIVWTRSFGPAAAFAAGSEDGVLLCISERPVKSESGLRGVASM